MDWEPAVPQDGVCAPVACSTALCGQFDGKDECYVLDAVAGSDRAHVAVALSTSTLKSYACGDGRLAHLCDLRGHSSAVTSVAFALPCATGPLYSSSADGTVRSWDVRSGREEQRQARLTFSMVPLVLQRQLAQKETKFTIRLDKQQHIVEPCRKLIRSHVEGIGSTSICSF